MEENEKAIARRAEGRGWGTEMTLEEVLVKLSEQLDWRSTGGSKQGHIVLTRAQAELLRETVRSALG